MHLVALLHCSRLAMTVLHPALSCAFLYDDDIFL